MIVVKIKNNLIIINQDYNKFKKLIEDQNQMLNYPTQ